MYISSSHNGNIRSQTPLNQHLVKTHSKHSSSDQNTKKNAVSNTHPHNVPLCRPQHSRAAPLARNPVTMSPHTWRVGDLGKKVVRTSAFYFPFYAAIFGWPLGAVALYNGRM